MIVRPNFAGYYCFPDDSAEDPFRVFIIDHTSTHASPVGGVPVSELNQTCTGDGGQNWTTESSDWIGKLEITFSEFQQQQGDAKKNEFRQRW